MSVYLRKKDRIYSQKSTRYNYINVFFKNLEFRSNQRLGLGSSPEMTKPSYVQFKIIY